MLLTRRTAARAGGIALALALTVTVGAPAAGAQTTAPNVVAPNSTTPPIITTVAGNGKGGFSGDGGAATKAKLTLPTGVVEDAAGDLYFADTLNYRIRKVTPAGIITTVAGTGTPGFTGDGGLATKARLREPSNPALDSGGNLYFADSENDRVRRISTAGIISTVAGNGSCGKSGNGGPATAAQLCDPSAVAIDSGGNLYIADSGNNEIRKVTPAGVISIFAGTGTFGSTGDGGLATAARLGMPDGVAVDSLHDVFIADEANNKIREVKTGIISTFAGTGAPGFGGDGGVATAAKLAHPEGIGVDPLGNVYIADSFNFRIRVVTTAGIIFTYAGTGVPGYSGDGGVATKARLSVPEGDLAVDANNVYFTDTLNQRVRRITGGPPPVIPETPLFILLPLSALVLIGGAVVVARRRRRSGVEIT
jgi:trimeric autotransporter adhesin